ncbi:MAG: sulfatase [Candidatus Altiarchaeota archaeon]
MALMLLPAAREAPQAAMLEANPRCIDCNVVIIVVDALRADHVSCLGYGRNTTPNICKFAEDGVLFREMLANSPSTKPSIASLFTSLYPSQHNAIDNEQGLNGNFTTLAEILKENGYGTYAVNSNAAIWANFNLNQGFIDWNDTNRTDAADINRIVFGQMRNYPMPFFLYVHYLDPHAPYTAPGEYYKYFNKDYNGSVTGDRPYTGTYNRKYFTNNPQELEQLKTFYDNEIVFVDSKIGEFIGRLKAEGIYNSSIIILMADHGEMFLEHGQLEHSNGLYGEVIEVPLIVKIPGYRTNTTSKTRVQTIDVMPTILDALNITTTSRMMGDPIQTIIDRPDRPIMSQHLRLILPNPSISLITGRYKVIKCLTNCQNTTYALYRIDEGEGEKNNVMSRNPSADVLVQELEDFIAKVNNTGTHLEESRVDLDQKTLEGLKALGYIN